MKQKLNWWQINKKKSNRESEFSEYTLKRVRVELHCIQIYIMSKIITTNHFNNN